MVVVVPSAEVVSSVEALPSAEAAPSAEAEAAAREADTRDSTEAGTTSSAADEADTEDDAPGGHAICNNRNSFPTTSRRLLESKPIDNTRTTMSLRPPTRA